MSIDPSHRNLQPEKQTLRDLEKTLLLVRVHHNEWPEELLGELFSQERQILGKRENQILELRVQGLKPAEIAGLLGVKVHTVWCRIRDIRFKLRTGLHERPPRDEMYKKYRAFRDSFRRGRR